MCNRFRKKKSIAFSWQIWSHAVKLIKTRRQAKCEKSGFVHSEHIKKTPLKSTAGSVLDFLASVFSLSFHKCEFIELVKQEILT